MDLAEKVLKAEKTLRLSAEMSKAYYDAPLILAYSGGKDSSVMLDLAEKVLKANEFEVLNAHTSVDMPETVQFIRSEFKRLNDKGIKATVYYPKYKDGMHKTMWNLIERKHSVPTRLQRFCCAELKEISTPNRLCALGVRGAESAGRKGRDTFGTRGATKEKAIFFSLDHTEEVHREAQEFQDPVWHCTLINAMENHEDTVVNPIYEFTDSDIWDYISQNSLKINPLYKKGRMRVGCVGCPMKGYKEKIRDFNEYPTYKKAYINAFDKVVSYRKAKGLPLNDIWKDGQSVFEWWIEENKHNCKGQIELKF